MLLVLSADALRGSARSGALLGHGAIVLLFSRSIGQMLRHRFQHIDVVLSDAAGAPQTACPNRTV
jgi:hypothetical protein